MHHRSFILAAALVVGVVVQTLHATPLTSYEEAELKKAVSQVNMKDVEKILQQIDLEEQRVNGQKGPSSSLSGGSTNDANVSGSLKKLFTSFRHVSTRK